jgi:hypothetical protein
VSGSNSLSGRSTVRPTLSLLFALGLVLAGVCQLYVDLFYRGGTGRGGGRIVNKIFLAGCTLSGVGASWLWIDFLSPNRGRECRKNDD